MILCLSGLKFSGKDTCADYLIKNHRFVRVALADPLKNMVSEEYGVERSSLDDPNRKEQPILSMPIDPKDDFTRMLAQFMKGEFRDQNGKRYGEGSPESVMYHTPRSLAILKGSVNRFVNPDYWTDKAFGIIEDLDNDDFDVVVTDVRYKSELKKFKERFKDNVVFIRVKRHETSTSTDPSEMDLVDAKFDYYIDNTGGKPYAYGQIMGILDKLK